MSSEDGRVTLLPKQICRLAELAAHGSAAVEVVQKGSVLYFNDGTSKVTVNAQGHDIHSPNQEPLW